MANWPALIERIADAANEWLPDGYILGYALAHDSQERLELAGAASIDAAVLTAADNEIKAHWRTRLAKYAGQGKPGASEDLAAIPADGTLAGGHHILVEILHRPTRIRAVRCYSYAAVLGIITNGALAVEQKRAQIRGAIQALYDECRARVIAAGGVP